MTCTVYCPGGKRDEHRCVRAAASQFKCPRHLSRRRHFGHVHRVTLPVVIADKPLFSDAMGAMGTYEGTYEGMLEHNITVVAHALGGKVDAKGLNGKLSESKK